MYASFFGLREPPFSLNTDPRFLWLSESHEEGLAALCYGIAARMGFVLLTGAVGTGKTTLLRAALARISDEFRPVMVSATSGLSGLDLLRLILGEFRGQRPPRGRGDCLIRLRSFLLERSEAGTMPVLIVDEAQSLSVAALEQLRLLSNLETQRGELLQIVLAGQPELRSRLARPDLRALSQRIVIDHHVESLRSYEIGPYLEHRIKVAGGRYPDVFEPGAESVLFAYSDGCPRLVSALADRVLLAAFSRGTRPVPRALAEASAKEFEARRSPAGWGSDGRTG